MSPSRERRAIVIAGGGTAGHVLPGLAVAAALVDGGRAKSDVIFVGSERGLEATMVPEAGFEVVMLPGRGIVRRLSAQNIGAVWGLIRAQATMLGWIRRTRPSVVVCLGGYASVAASVAAIVWRVPIVVTEQNARAGAANRLMGRFARVCAVPAAGTDLPRAVVTGNPIRAEIRAQSWTDPADRIVRRRAARLALDIDPDRKLVAVFAGSLGARRINEATVGLAENWSGRSDLWIRHVIGARDWESRPEPATRLGGLRYEAVRYEERMDQLMAAADVVVCRAGGTTVAELAVIGLPAILVPLPIAPRDHQRANAAVLVAAGAAVLVDDSECRTERLAAELGPILEEDDRRATMTAAAASIGRPDAAAAVADLAVRAAAGERW
jgi:UDP-N-acetylglucosamine--N-acetylmuramyl-(pentapeptide) pyrophosphoryl-undecaprenol N-acetylglucosamine transferase